MFCWQEATVAPVFEYELPTKKLQLLNHCRKIIERYDYFRSASGEVIHGMVKEMRVPLNNLGVDVRQFYKGHRTLRLEETLQ